MYDPFSGSGTVALEAWIAERDVIATDLSPYAILLTRAKLNPHASLEDALKDFRALAAEVTKSGGAKTKRDVPQWVAEFFHPKTLAELLAWTDVLRRKRKHFILACLLGILHHQRPGFLSFPSSHTVPYLRRKRFPQRRFPELYEYRGIAERLEAKIKRAFRRVPSLDFSQTRAVYQRSADKMFLEADAIITSPPYMHQLDYGRDNRLRLWFLGVEDWKNLDEKASPNEIKFLRLMERCFTVWREVLSVGGKCVLVVGDVKCRTRKKPLPDVLTEIATESVGGYRIKWNYRERIPNERRVRRGHTGSISETVLVLERQA